MSRPESRFSTVNFRLNLLGPSSLTDAGGALVAGLGPGKPLAMLAYLVVNGRARREELVALLWAEIPEDRARNAFRQTLHRLRSALGIEVVGAERDVISAESGDRLWCDAREFEEFLTKDVERAIQLYRGEFLSGLDVGSAPFEHWTESHRARLAAQYRGALTRAAQLRLEAGEIDAAVNHARALSQAAPLEGEAAMLEASVLVAAGRKAEAISVLTRHATQMQSELGASASAGVKAMLHRLVNDSPPATASAGVPALLTDELAEAEFVGRDQEMARLLGLWRRIDKQSVTAVVTGIQGIGKTRLLTEFIQRLNAFGSLLQLWGQERPGNQAIPYAALADALRPAVNAPGVAGASQHLLSEAARLLPEIRDQFDLPQASPIQDDGARLRFYEGVAALLDAVAYEQPVCMVVEDLHLGSTSSVALLHFLTQRLSKSPILFVISYRPGEASAGLLDRFPPSSQHEAGGHAMHEDSGNRLERLNLQPLSPEDSERIVRSVTTPGELDSGSFARIAAVSDGVPFRALELVRRVRRGEAIANLPGEIAPILWARLQSCSPNEQRLFVACSLLGRPAPLRILAAATHLAEPDAFDAALSLERRGLVVQRRGGIAPAHDAVAVLALEGTGSAGRALLAGWTADALASENAGTNAELAYLYSGAGQPSSAHRYARAAVLDAAASAAHDDVDSLLSLAAQTAMNANDRAAVESLRNAFGGGARRLSEGPTPATAQADRGRDAPEQVAARSASAEAAPGDVTREPVAAARDRPWVRRRVAVFSAALLALSAAIAFAASRDPAGGARGTVLGDTLVVVEKRGPRSEQAYFVSGSILPTAALAKAPAGASGPAWMDSLSLPWLNPSPSPDGQFVALERITTEGTDLYVIRADRRDTVALGTSRGDDIMAGWSPDSRWVLVVEGVRNRLGYDTDLYAYSILAIAPRVPLDTSSATGVVDAVWSPLGPYVAWTARIGESRQQDVFVGRSDGTATRNFSDHPSEDYNVVWSPNGERLVFTSDRDGNAELYSGEVAASGLRRLTFEPSQDDHASYSPDGDFIAFESTRTGRISVHVMPPLGGSARRITPQDKNFELAGWRGPLPPFIERLRLSTPDVIAPGDTATVNVVALDQYGSGASLPEVEWLLLDGSAEFSPSRNAEPSPGGGRSGTLRTRRAGLVRLVASAAGWRSDTGYISVGDSPLRLVSEDFENGLASARWAPLGTPRPMVVRGSGAGGSFGLVMNADRQWESGLLSRGIFPLRPGISFQVRVQAPFASVREPGGFSVALVAAESDDAIEESAPQFLRIAAIAWLAESGRLAYSAEREYFSERAVFSRPGAWHVLQIVIQPDGRAAFYIDGRLRRHSSVVLTDPGEEPRVQVWLGGHATGARVIMDDVQLSLGRQR